VTLAVLLVKEAIRSRLLAGLKLRARSLDDNHRDIFDAHGLPGCQDAALDRRTGVAERALQGRSSRGASERTGDKCRGEAGHRSGHGAPGLDDLARLVLMVVGGHGVDQCPRLRRRRGRGLMLRYVRAHSRSRRFCCLRPSGCVRSSVAR
jgi:hypothetical protein